MLSYNFCIAEVIATHFDAYGLSQNRCDCVADAERALASARVLGRYLSHCIGVWHWSCVAAQKALEPSHTPLNGLFGYASIKDYHG